MLSRKAQMTFMASVILAVVIVLFVPVIPAHLTPACLGRDCPVTPVFKIDLGPKDCDNILVSGLYLIMNGKYGLNMKYGDPCLYA